ncbi:SAV_915 family protein [Streptomyces sp. XY006]|uniref:SAV_915 family protein n=1 Tax=Streptomyces sp. XY006 TaxID=2021410 RepID=UPI00211AB9B1|nr:SAV_915 family protein [Streptomyces sp. XY006]
MAVLLDGDESEPPDRFPAGPLYVPVRPGPNGYGYMVRLFRSPLGVRTTVGFTCERRLTATLGPGQRWIRLAEPALRAMTAPLGITTVTVDPLFAAPPPALAPVPAPVPAPAPTPAPAPAPVTTPASASTVALLTT